MKHFFNAVLGSALSLLFAIILLLLVGESPLILLESIENTLFTGFGLGHSLFYTTSLIFAGLSFSIGYHCGLFNVGAEGQLLMGSLGVVLASHIAPHLPPIVSHVWALSLAVLLGMGWASIAGLLKVYRNSHEVITTILLNFIAVSLASFLIQYPLKNPEVQNPETFPVANSYTVPSLSELGLTFFQSTPVNLTLLLAILFLFGVYALLFHTSRGFELRAVGTNPRASQYSRISVKTNRVLAITFCGGLAALISFNDVLGYHHHVTSDFSPGYGFTGIAVALLARNHPLGIFFSALFFGFLTNGSRELEFLSEKVTKELSLVIQAVFIAAVVTGPKLHSFLKGLFRARTA